MADANTFNYFQAMTNPQFATQQLQIQQQQQLAQKLMEEGSQQEPNSQLANPSGMVIANSPIASASKAIEKGLGGYISGKALAAQMQAYQGLHDQMAQTQSNPQAIGAAMNPQAMYQDPQFMANAALVGVDNATKEYIERTKQTDLMKNAGNPLTAPYMAKDQLVNVNGHMQPASSLLPAPQAQLPLSNPAPSAVPTASGGGNPAITPQSPEGQAALSDMLGTPPVDAPAPVNITSTVGQNVDWNNPSAAKQADSQAEKTGENTADVAKTLNVMQSNLPMVMQRFEKMRGAAKDASYGPLAVDDPDGTPAKAVTFHDAFNDETAQANGIIQQTSAQGVLPELGPTLAQAGIKGNKFLETLSSNASAIPLHQAPEVKLNTINGLESQYINNLKSTAAQARALGQKAPSDAEIDAAVTQSKTATSQSHPLDGTTAKNSKGEILILRNGQWIPQ